MRARMISLCERLVEAGWLAAVVAVPIAFNQYADRMFEMTKTTMFRSMALVMLAAAGIRWLLQTREPGDSTDSDQRLIQRAWDVLTYPLSLPALALGGVCLLTTVTSVLPRLSLAGSYRRVQGAYTLLTYLVLFFCLLHFLRRREQLDRLLSTVLLTSLPVSLYAVLQHYQLDPLIWGYDTAWRAPSTLGNPIFSGAYFIMVIPVTLQRVITSVQGASWRPERRLRSLLTGGGYLAILGLQLTALLFTRSRGPILGLAGGLFFFLLLVGARQGSKTLVAVALVMALLFAGFLVATNLPGPVAKILRNMPYLGRLAGLLESTTVQQRILIWQGAADMLKNAEWRVLVGHGPETMFYVFQPYVLPELVQSTGQTIAHDRAHNAAWDALLTQGLLGLAVYVCLLGSIFYRGLELLGLVRRCRQDRLWFAALAAIGTSLGALLPRLLLGTWAYLGLGLSSGLLIALLLFLLRAPLTAPISNVHMGGSDLLVIALVSAVAAHFVEIQVGVPVGATQVLFWVYAAVIAALASSTVSGSGVLSSSLDASGASLDRAVIEETRPGSSHIRPRRRRRPGGARLAALLRTPLASSSLILGLLLLILSTSFVTGGFQLRSHAPLVLLFFIVWVGGTALTILDLSRQWDRPSGHPGWGRWLRFSLVLSLLMPAVGLPLYVLGLPASGQPATMVLIEYVLLGLSMLALAWALPSQLSPEKLRDRGGRVWPCLALLLVTAVPITLTNVNVSRANVYFRASQALVDARLWNRAITFGRRATQLAPGQPHYQLFLGRTYIQRALDDPVHRDRWLERAEEALLQAVELNPLDPDHYAHLGQIFQYRAQTIEETGERMEVLSKALAYYDAAVKRSPTVQAALLVDQRAAAHETLARGYASMDEPEKAISHAESAIELVEGEARTDLDQLLDQLRSQER